MTESPSQTQPTADPRPAAPGPQNGRPAVDHAIRRQEMAGRPIAQRTIMTICAALMITFAFDRLVCSITPAWLSGYAMPAFWMICTATISALHWRTACRRPLAWLVSGSVIALGIWEMLFSTTWAYSANLEYAMTTALAQPALLMLHCQLANGRYDVRHPFQVAWNWFTGWFMQPFMKLKSFSEPFSIMFARFATASGKRSKAREIGVAMLVSIPLLLAIVPLLTGADQVFRYELASTFGHIIDPTEFILHAAIVLLPWPFLSSLLIGLDGKPASTLPERRVALSTTTTIVVLLTTLLVYALFCAVQFRFLFAGLFADGSIALPDGLTYSEYARGGFFQLLAVTAINLTIFGVALTFTPRTRPLSASLIALLTATAIMLASAALRLGLYIDAYGLTWLRYVSMTFIALLAIAILLCLARLKANRLPLVATLVVLFIVWYVALGFSNPGWVCETFNAFHGFDAASSVQIP
jgi:hypothetical protein